MSKRNILLALAVFVLSTVAAMAASIDGKWVAQVPGRDGETRTQTYTFKADGDKLTGTVGGPMGERDIQDGKVSGDDVSWTMSFDRGGNPVTIKYTGKVAGDELKIKMETPRGSREITAKRATT